MCRFDLNVVVVIGIIIAKSLSFTNVATGEDEMPAVEARVIPVERFFKEMQLLARRVPVGNTKLDQEDSLKTLRLKIHEEFDGAILEYAARVDAIDWSNEMATFKTLSPISAYKPSAALPFKITKTQSLSIPLSRSATAGVNTRKPLKFRGKLLFVDGKYGSIGRPPATQSVFSIQNSQYKGIVSIGTFITDNYSISIGEDELFAQHPPLDIK